MRVNVPVARRTGEVRCTGRFDLSHDGRIAAIQRADSTDGMQHSHLLPSSSGSPLPERFLSRLAGFADLFTRPTWSNVLVLLAGVILAPGRRTVTAALRILGRDRDPGFCTFHRILNRAAWSSRAGARMVRNMSSPAIQIRISATATDNLLPPSHMKPPVLVEVKAALKARATSASMSTWKASRA